jgi:uncharacterized protein
MIADAHYHLDPRLESVERLLAQMKEHGIAKVALIASPCEPLHVGKAGAMLVKAMRRALQGGAPRLGRILYCRTVHSSGRVSFLGKSAAIYPLPDNDAVEHAISAHPDQFVGWVFLNPKAKAPVEEAERRFRTPGWIGVKAHPFWYRPLWEDALRRDNVFVDLSSPYLDKALRHRALRELGAARCLYGSDGPYGYPGRDGGYDHGAILRQIVQAGLSSQDLDRVLGGNFKALALA